ncbi:MAG: Ig-like domain repeat protein, partial [Verrucomicrobia bacterium]|nr:Ig-like domain repeat protein [Verrucomicrobiota bacterium]
MSSDAPSAIPPSSALLKLSLLVLPMGILLLPIQARAQCTTSGNVTTCTSSGAINVSSTYGFSESSTAAVNISGTVTAISVSFGSLNITNLNSVSIALQPPSGTAFDLFGGSCNSGSANFTLADTGPFGPGNLSGMPPALGISNCPSALSGSYLAADYYANFQTPVFNAGGSGGPATFNSAGIGNSQCVSLGITCGSYNFATAFGLPVDGSEFNGTWTLYIASQNTSGSSFNPSGSLQSWSISFTTAAVAATTTSVSASPNGSTSLVYTSSDVHGDATTPTSVTLTATVTSGSTVNQGTLTFYDSTGTTAGSGTVIATAVPVSNGVAQTVTTFPGTKEGSRSISAVYSGGSSFAGSTSSTAAVLTTNHPYNPSTGTFCNGPVTLNNTGAGVPYPSLLALGTGNSQLTGTIENVTVTLNNISLQNETELENLGFLLQAPGNNTSGTGSSGNAFQFLSWAGNPFTSGTLTFSDQGTSSIPYNMAPACSICLPTDNWIDIGSDNPDTFPAPAPATFSTAAPTGSGTFTTSFGGQGANNTWSLYPDTRIVEPGPAGTIGSWCLNFTMQANAHPTATTVSGSQNPASFIPPATTASITLTANVSVTDSSGLTVNAGTVTFVDHGTNLGSPTVTNGVATLGTTLTEGTHEIVATYSGTNSGTEFGISSGHYDQRVDTATTIPSSGSGAGPYTYCNSGPITAPGLGADAGAASPYPSNIFVTNLPGTVKALTVTLNGFSTKDQGDLLNLLVGPRGNNLDFFSLTGSNVSSAPSPFNVTFDDTASSVVTGNLTSSGTFRPTSNNAGTNAVKYPQCPANAPNCASPPVGPPLPANPFTPTNIAAPAGSAILGNANAAGVFGGTSSSTYNGNGTWSLYMDDGGPTGGGEASFLTGGWCINLTENLPSVSVTKSHTGTFTQGQQGVPFTVNIKNNGNGSTGDPTDGKNPLTVTDTLNSAFSYAGFSGTGWSCAATG